MAKKNELVVRVQLPEESTLPGTLEFSVHSYLTYPQIQQIVDSLRMLAMPDKKGKVKDSWALRQTNIDMLLLFHGTDLSKERLEQTTHEDWLMCGAIDKIKNELKNYNQLLEAIEWSESVSRSLVQISGQIPDIVEPLLKLKMRGIDGNKQRT